MLKPALKLALIYLIIGLLYIIISAILVSTLTSGSADVSSMQTIKDVVFVVISALFILWLVGCEIKNKNQFIGQISDKIKWANIFAEHIAGVEIFLLDRNLVHIAVFGQGLKEYGYHAAQILNKSLSELEVDPVLYRFLSIHYAAILSGEKVKQELNLNGRWYEFSGNLLQIKKAKEKQMIAAVFIDITQRKDLLSKMQLQTIELEEAAMDNRRSCDELNSKITSLSDSVAKIGDGEQKYKMFFDNINDAAYIYEVENGDRSGKFLEVNQKLVEYLEFTREELLELYPDEIVAPDYLEKFKGAESFFRKTKHQYIELDYQTKYGKKVPIELSLHYFQYGEKHMVFATARDIRERMKYIRKLKKAKEKAEESDNLKSAFLANISHEVRTPMNGIIGFTDLLVHPDVTSGQRLEYAVLIKKSTDQLLHIIQDILDISRIDTGQLKLVKSDYSLNNVMEDVFDYANATIASMGRQIELKYTSRLKSPDDTIKGDPKYLKKLVQNVVHNAIKFTHTGEIAIDFGLDEKRQLKITITDTGIGIAEETMPRVFEKFRQADESHTREYGGIGLGLPIVKGLIDLMEGAIDITSSPGSGARVELTLPYIRSKKIPEQAMELEKKVMPQLKGKNLLIVEDNNENSTLLAEYVHFLKGKTIIARNGKGAMEAIVANRDIDLVLMDIKLPDVSGLEVVKQMKEMYPALIIIAQTAYTLPDEKRQAINAGCSDFISKPIEMREFYRVIARYL